MASKGADRCVSYLVDGIADDTRGFRKPCLNCLLGQAGCLRDDPLWMLVRLTFRLLTLRLLVLASWLLLILRMLTWCCRRLACGHIVLTAASLTVDVLLTHDSRPSAF